MKVFFCRHGEAMDDIEDRYGGWFDAPLSDQGVNGAKGMVEYFHGVEVELILTSPLKRAVQTAQILGKELGTNVEILQYLKERNSYGLLSGENKAEAKAKYPEIVAAYEQGEEVLGYENPEFFLKRVKELISVLEKREEKVLICVTHGVLLKTLFKEIIGKEAKKFRDNAIAEIEIDSSGRVTLIKTDKVDFV